jgi:hypothetical protein
MIKDKFWSHILLYVLLQMFRTELKMSNFMKDVTHRILTYQLSVALRPFQQDLQNQL